MKIILCVFFLQFVTLALSLDLSINAGGFQVGVQQHARGLRLGYYRRTCPDVESIVRQTVYKYLSHDRTLAAPLLRMHFHDCFIRGCDASVLLSGEKGAFPNLSIRGFNVIDAVKAALEKKCPGVVSCADILTLVARDAVHMIGGPFWYVPTGRRDGRVSIALEAAQLPSPFANITTLKSQFAAIGLSIKDLVVLSGGHTIGLTHCSLLQARLYNFTGKGDSDPSLDSEYAIRLKKKCQPGNIKTTVEMDPGSFRTFDGSYYKLVGKRRGIFVSDAALLDDVETKAYVKLQAGSNGASFGRDFAESMVKLGYIGVLTGKQGEIRRKCGFVN